MRSDGLSLRFRAIHIAHRDLTRSWRSPEQHRRSFGLGQHGLGLGSPLELFVQTFNWIRCANRFPLALRETREDEQLFARFLQSVGDRATIQPPFG
jgi:hypothetical protein